MPSSYEKNNMLFFTSISKYYQLCILEMNAIFYCREQDLPGLKSSFCFIMYWIRLAWYFVNKFSGDIDSSSSSGQTVLGGIYTGSTPASLSHPPECSNRCRTSISSKAFTLGPAGVKFFKIPFYMVKNVFH